MKNWYIDQLDKLPEDTIAYKPSDEKWSLLQIIQHLILVKELSIQYINKKLANSSGLKQAGMQAKLKKILLQIALSLPIKFKAPVSTLIPEQNLNKQDVLARWETVRQQWMETLAALDENTLHKELFKHPIAGMLNLFQAVDFIYSHGIHHQKQFKETLLLATKNK